MIRVRWGALALISLLIWSGNAGSVAPTQVVSFYPTGAVKRVQQATARFSADMVAMGDPRSKTDPFDISCGGKGKKKVTVPKYKTRWADSKNWSLDFDQPLPAGVQCTFKLKYDFKDSAGNTVVGLEEYRFTTSGPALLGVAPMYGEIEPAQYFVSLADGLMDTASVESKAYFEVEGMPDKVGAKIIQGSEREAVIRAAVKSDWRWYSYDRLLKQKPQRAFSELNEFENFLVLSATRRFPEKAKIVLHWPKGILSQSGLAVDEPQKFDFKVMEPFQATFSCERANADRPCNSILDMRLSFAKMVPRKLLQGAKLVAESGETWTPKEFKKDPRNAANPPEQLDSLTFEAPFPSSAKFKLILPSGIQDEIGRKLTNAKQFPLAVATDEALPLIKFPALFGILELKGDPVLPVSVRNVEKKMAIQQLAYEGKSFSLSSKSSVAEIIDLYRKVMKRDYDYNHRNIPILSEKQGEKFKIAKPLGERELELVGIPLKKPGFYVVEMESPRLGKALTGKEPMYVPTSALVTDMAVHLKKGQESSLVWVTRLSDAKPVHDADISIVDVSGKQLASGTTDKNGILRLGQVSYPCSYDSEDPDYDACEVYVFAKKDDDVSFTSSSWSKGIENYRFNLASDYLSKEWGPVVAHTVLNRMAAKPGDVIEMKHFLREHRIGGFSLLNEKRLPKRVLVVHAGSRKTYTLPFEIDKKSGTATGKFTIPKDATLGHYSIYLSNKDDKPKPKEGEESEESDAFDWSAQETGYFIVSEYRIPLMKAAVKIQGENLVRPKTVKMDLSASYLSGGPARNLKVKLRASLQASSFTLAIPGSDYYSFFGTPLKTGVIDSETHQPAEESFLKVQDVKLGADGGLLTSIKGLPSQNRAQELVVEMEYTDPNGEIKTTDARAPIFPANYVVGLRSASWYSEPGKTKVLGVITHTSGKAKADRPYTVEAFRTNYITHRKRLVGGFYSYDSKTQITSLGKVCSGKSDVLGRFECVPNKLPPGSITLQAKTVDEKGRATYAQTSVSIYAAGAGNWWVPSDSDRIDLLPEKNDYEPGEKAKLIVRSPYPVATALVTIEREGVLDSFVTEVRRENPVIEIPLKGNYAPNVFVSALLIRGRVGTPQPTALLDLARPAMKMGVVGVKVGWKAHELGVSVKTDKKKYKAREKAQVTVQVKLPNGENPPSGSEVAIAAVDEGLLRLKENVSWKIIQAMMGHRGLSVTTSSGQNQVVGKRHYGSKARPPGGGGGFMTEDGREFFEPVLFWQPRVKLDRSGEARVTIPLNDSMTSFRMVAVASVGENYFGDGSTTVESSKDLILYSGFAPLAREGDQIKNAFTVRNTTDQPMKIELDVTSKEIEKIPALPVLNLKPSEARTLDLPLTIPEGLKNIAFSVRAKDELSGAEDLVVSKMKIVPAVPARVLQATLFQLDKSHKITVKQPADALSGKGGLGVSARATLASGLTGVKSYMEDYAYGCLEQKISKAIALENSDEVKKLIETLPSYLDSTGIAKFFPTSSCGSVMLSRYVLGILHENKFEIPGETLKKMLSGLTAYVEGQYSCQNWWDESLKDAYVTQTKVLAMETLSRYRSFKPELLSTVQKTPNLWATEAVTAWFQLLKRQSDIPNRDEDLKQAENILRARVNFQGSIMNLQQGIDEMGEWRLFTSPDQEALGVLGVSIGEASWKEDVGRMARGIVARLKEGHWDTTMANAWGVTQLRRFSAEFEKDSVEGETKVDAGDVHSVFKWKESPKGKAETLTWPEESEKKSVEVQFTHTGSGKPWVHFETKSAIPLKAPMDFGYKVSRKVTPVIQSIPGSWKVGDVANVELTITSKFDHPWVVVRDAIPAGASHLGTGLDGSSQLLDRTPKKKGSASGVQEWPTEYEEKSHADFISYAGYLSRGTYHLNYRVRLNSAGEFKIPPTRVEAMYSPEVFGEIPNANWKVAP